MKNKVKHTWNHRVVRHVDGITLRGHPPELITWLGIHEVHYDDRGSIISISEDPMGPSGETLEELKADMEYFLQAFNRPVLRKEEIEFAVMDDGEEGDAS